VSGAENRGGMGQRGRGGRGGGGLRKTPEEMVVRALVSQPGPSAFGKEEEGEGGGGGGGEEGSAPLRMPYKQVMEGGRERERVRV
jgi:hypothetical protein